MAQRLLVHFDQFVAGGDDGDPGPGKHAELPRTTGCRSGDLGGRNARTPGHDHVSRASLGSHGNDVFAGLRCCGRGKGEA